MCVPGETGRTGRKQIREEERKAPNSAAEKKESQVENTCDSKIKGRKITSRRVVKKRD